MVYEPTTNFKDSNGVDLGKKLITQDYVATVYPSLSQSAAGFIASPAELYNWGLNNNGQIGDNTQGTTLIRSTPRQEFTASTNWKSINCGSNHSAAIKTDGTLWIWGNNTFRQIGDNTSITRSTPRQISIASANGSTGWKQVSCGAFNTVAVREDGTLWTWGTATSFGTGDNTFNSRSTPRQISIASANGLTGWKQVSVGEEHFAAIRTDGTLWCWGRNTEGQLGINSAGSSNFRLTPAQEFTASTNWKMVSCGANNTSALKTDGTLWVWGDNTLGQIGDNTTAFRSTPRQEITLSTNWKSVSSGGSCTLGIKTNGTLWAWGSNGGGRLGDNTTANRSTPRQEFTASTNWKQAQISFSIAAIKTDGTLWVCGAYTGDNTIAARSTVVQEISLSNKWRQASTGNNFSAAIKFPIGQ